MPASAEARIGGRTRLAGVIGWPVEHSLSPAIHNAAFAAAGLDWVYVPLPVEPDGLQDALVGLAPLGFAGVNVTMPHKTEAAELIERLSEDAALLRAVNTIHVVGDRLEGHNTDVGGFDRFLRRDAGFDPAGRSALLYGAGLGRLAVVARSEATTGGLRAIAATLGVPLQIVDPADAAGRRFDLVVNATPVGGDAQPDHRSHPDLDPDVLVVDLLYDPPSTALQRRARAAGATVFGGIGLLVEQAALSFELWTGTPAPLEVMSAAALAGLAER
ncbi:MAG TPA: shikimate dehydrogenase [Actinomycetota bacterium]|nr:shikimate dehydrogenase [Actinomycetota bacterium]